MGNLTSRAKATLESRAVYAPLSSPDPSAPTPQPTPEQQISESRRKNLLARDRGHFGTVQTGFRGLLGLASSYGQRKTLLGE